MWQKINKVMVKKKIPNPNFNGFMANIVHVNWNIVCIVYDFDDPNKPMVDKDRTCYFHWISSMDKHTKQQIKLELCE
jgi:hypothetical protein